jgi:hypothetical protein
MTGDKRYSIGKKMMKQAIVGLAILYILKILMRVL